MSRKSAQARSAGEGNRREDVDSPRNKRKPQKKGLTGHSRGRAVGKGLVREQLELDAERETGKRRSAGDRAAQEFL